MCTWREVTKFASKKFRLTLAYKIFMHLDLNWTVNRFKTLGAGQDLD